MAPPSPLSRSTTLSASGSSLPGQELDALLADPTDLLCPITCSIFRDPVLTAAGQAYERQAIEQHLQQANTDPLSRAILPSKALTPVHLLRSRALEYRESTARACVEIACSSSCHQPVRFVRRACELAGDDVRVKGLTPQCIAYVTSHPSNAYDSHVMHSFAQSLYDGGYRDKAAAVYHSLLQTGGLDRVQQAELLKLILKCWAGETGTVPDGSLDAVTLDKLAQYVEGQPNPLWGQILDVCNDAGMGQRFALTLCEQLLLRYSSAQGGAGNVPENVRWAMERELLLRFVQMMCSTVLKDQTAMRAEMSDIVAWRHEIQEEEAAMKLKEASKGKLQRVPQHQLLGCVAVSLSAILRGVHPFGRLVGVGAGLLLTLKGDKL